ncbi:extracellular solute-binding protein [Mesorhizobium sp. M4B.F.Ca.ET.215.01.1.1]|uniref:extracellular solute-binding protein n=1 Tax=unclassified Mesorhizobium TaxID=325217 RepID=UPI000FCA7CA6|nr:MULTISPECIES: extracellular solute-binding protein [unclassified Mesorhizobium]RUW27010.1 extracellular solute-binding protein [Mesorhizobium sp. M4B.F.Ca.ET.013.02.1.1]RUW78750.1 extracellular solute-binding protein [Mesorhizobium sp. M4B.F.Ca.ET.049.02.1.2]RVD46648.1 extracellular solute-binding protein [Mesorhizobium sp. M4B.F.Ca.ET.019.03.1.1]RWF67802.1 MAG: extracellular solute-binding protein [Mesorhizobium sp.]RWX71080.1 extracellular solute-binding protein [Mesorhizobium sp. M4B.F.C
MRSILTALTSAMLLAAASSAALAEEELSLYNWGNYTSPELLEKFKKETGIKVTVTDYDSNDTALSKVRAGGSGFDMVVPSANFVPIWIKEGLLLESRPDQMPNFKNVDERWVNVSWDPGRHYSVPWQWGMTGPVVATSVYKGDINTSAIWLDPPQELKGKINVVPEKNDVLYAAIRYVGGTWCTGDKALLKKVRDKLLEAKKSWVSMDYGIEKMDSRDTLAQLYYNGAAFRARQVNADIKLGFPKEGYSLFMDSVAILADAPHPDNAKKFLNFIMAPENAALISNFATYANGIKGSTQFMRDDIKAAPELNIPAEYIAAGGWQEVCPAEVDELYTRIWTDLMK